MESPGAVQESNGDAGPLLEAPASVAAWWDLRRRAQAISPLEGTGWIAAMMLLKEAVYWLAEESGKAPAAALDLAGAAFGVAATAVHPIATGLAASGPAWSPAIMVPILWVVLLLFFIARLAWLPPAAARSLPVAQRLGLAGLARPVDWRGEALFIAVMAGASLAVLLAAGAVFLPIVEASMYGGDAAAATAATSGLSIQERMIAAYGVRNIGLVDGLLMATAVPLVEEVFFRGVFYGVLRGVFGVVAAIAASSLIFGLAHGGVPVSQLIGGVVFAVSYERRGTLLAPVVLHALANGSLLAVSFMATPAGSG